MKVFLLACLVALALARQEDLSVSTETSESLSNSQEFITHINKEKLQKAKHVEQQQVEDELQDKIHPFIQSQPLTFPFTQPIPCTPLAQNIVPAAQAAAQAAAQSAAQAAAQSVAQAAAQLAAQAAAQAAAQSIVQPAVVPPFLPVLSPEVQEAKAKLDTILSKHSQMPFLNSETVLRLFDSPIPNLTDLKNQHLAQSLLQSLVHQAPQAIPQTPVALSQPQLSVPQSKVLLLPQQVIPFPQRDMASQDLLQLLQLLSNPTSQFPATQPVDPVV